MSERVEKILIPAGSGINVKDLLSTQIGNIIVYSGDVAPIYISVKEYSDSEKWIREKLRISSRE